MMKKIVFAAVLALASASSMATEYITNGTFSDDQSHWTTFQYGWGAGHVTFYAGNGYGYSPDQDLILKQGISGAVGDLTLSFDLAISSSAGYGDYESVVFNGVTLGTYVWDNDLYQRLSFNVVGTGNDTLVFIGRNAGGANLIANVSLVDRAGPVSSVPEPATYGMILAGLGLLGLIAFRKRSGAV